MKILSVVVATICIVFSPALAQAKSKSPSSSITAEGVWVRRTPKTAENTAAYVVLKNSSRSSIKLTGGDSPLSNSVELHEIIRTDGMAQMKQVESIEIPAGGSIELKPGATHIMLIGLKPKFKTAKTAPLSLRFSDGSSLKLDPPISETSPTASPTPSSH